MKDRVRYHSTIHLPVFYKHLVCFRFLDGSFAESLFSSSFKTNFPPSVWRLCYLCSTFSALFRKYRKRALFVNLNNHIYAWSWKVSPLIHNAPKWSNTLSKPCSKCYKIFKMWLTVLGHYASKSKTLSNLSLRQWRIQQNSKGQVTIFKNGHKNLKIFLYRSCPNINPCDLIVKKQLF